MNNDFLIHSQDIEHKRKELMCLTALNDKIWAWRNIRPNNKKK